MTKEENEKYETDHELHSKSIECENCAAVNANLVRPFDAKQHPVIRVFLNGFNLDRRSGALQVSAAPTNLQGTQLTIKVTMGKKTLIDKICLSWIAFSPSTVSFVSYGGQVSKDNFQDLLAKTSAALFINLLTLSMVSISSPSSVEKVSLSPQISVKISSSQLAHLSPLIASQLFILPLDLILQRFALTVELKTSFMEILVLLHAQLELSLIPIRMEVLHVDHAQLLLD